MLEAVTPQTRPLAVLASIPPSPLGGLKDKPQWPGVRYKWLQREFGYVTARELLADLMAAFPQLTFAKHCCDGSRSMGISISRKCWPEAEALAQTYMESLNKEKRNDQ